jgi:hypothetical protein
MTAGKPELVFAGDGLRDILMLPEASNGEELKMPVPVKKKSRRDATTNANGQLRRAAPKKSAKRKLTNARLRKLAAKHRPPLSWYDEDQNLF